MKAAKTFKWEAAHRLPWHNGDCKNLHGHSYHMTVELEGKPDKRGMLIDFAEIKKIIKPLVDAWDHATLVAENDHSLLQAIRQLESRYFTLPFDSTSENLCQYVVNYLQQQASELLELYHIDFIRVKVQETETCYAEVECHINRKEEKLNQGINYATY